MNRSIFGGFFDELEKIALTFRPDSKFSPMAQAYAKTLQAAKAAPKGVEGAAYRAQNITRSIRAAAAGVQAQPPPMAQPTSILDKIKARNAAGKGATQRRFVSESAAPQGSSIVNPQTGRSQHILDKMKARLDPTKANPQVQQARQAEIQARTGTLGANPKTRVL